MGPPRITLQEWDAWVPPDGEVHRNPLIVHKGLLITGIKLLARQVVIRLAITVRAVPARITGSRLFRKPVSDAGGLASSAYGRGDPARGKIGNEYRPRDPIQNGAFGVVHGHGDESLAPVRAGSGPDGLLDRSLDS